MDPARPPVASGEEVDYQARAPGADRQPAAMDGQSEEDWDRRVLCPDGSCVGILGEDSRCSVCGRSGGSGASAASVGPSATSESSEAGVIEERSADPDDGWSRRQLCSDGACLGVIGDNALCGVCGKAP